MPSLAAAAALLVLAMACAHAHVSLRHRALAVCIVAYPFAALHVVAGVALLAAGACAALAFLGATALLVLLSAAECLLVPAAAVLFVLALKWAGYFLVPSCHKLAAATGNKLVCGLQRLLARITGFIRDGRCMSPRLFQPVLAAGCVALHFAAIVYSLAECVFISLKIAFLGALLAWFHIVGFLARNIRTQDSLRPIWAIFVLLYVEVIIASEDVGARAAVSGGNRLRGGNPDAVLVVLFYGASLFAAAVAVLWAMMKLGWKAHGKRSADEGRLPEVTANTDVCTRGHSALACPGLCCSSQPWNEWRAYWCFSTPNEWEALAPATQGLCPLAGTAMVLRVVCA